MILTDEEIKAAYLAAERTPTTVAGWVGIQKLLNARAIESALLDKLLKGVDVPEPHEYVWNPDGTFNIGQERALSTKAGPCHGWEIYPIFTDDQLLAYGAAQRLAGRERETCTWTEQDDLDMPGTYTSSCGEMWSFIDGGVKEDRVTYCHHCGGKVVPASPQEQA